MNLDKLPFRKIRHIAEDLVRTGIKVHRYRHDQLEPELATQLNEDIRALDKVRKEKSDDQRPRLQELIEKLDATLRKAGGTFYPHRSWSENVEMLLVGAFLVIGIRTFFFQPFIIPTNSMYPTYYGMTHENYVIPDQEEAPPPTPSKPIQFLRKLLVGATHVELIAKNDGELQIGQHSTVKARKWLIFPTQKLEFPVYVGSQLHKIQVPVDFHAIRDILSESQLLPYSQPRHVKKGEKILSFDILSGDALFVDRMSYHFRKPDIGDPFVFKTNLVTSNDDQIYSVLKYKDPGKYYIKRLVGKGEDTLQLKGSALIRNGNPIDGAKAFDMNAGRIGKYPGYVLNRDPDGRFMRTENDIVSIPQDHYFAMGDNSPNSSDSRTWGFVPKNAIIGRAIFIYYPFTKRWGISR